VSAWAAPGCRARTWSARRGPLAVLRRQHDGGCCAGPGQAASAFAEGALSGGCGGRRVEPGGKGGRRGGSALRDAGGYRVRLGLPYYPIGGWVSSSWTGDQLLWAQSACSVVTAAESCANTCTHCARRGWVASLPRAGGGGRLVDARSHRTRDLHVVTWRSARALQAGMVGAYIQGGSLDGRRSQTRRWGRGRSGGQAVWRREGAGGGEGGVACVGSMCAAAREKHSDDMNRCFGWRWPSPGQRRRTRYAGSPLTCVAVRSFPCTCLIRFCVRVAIATPVGAGRQASGACCLRAWRHMAALECDASSHRLAFSLQR